ncbi:MAG: hypothetical protein GY913_06330 [Proteobacteria bacterium]|nr:hypothetical protein [Pseudomonadota bacterium]MCP4916524.1 hypothetical protein [Pseudomonadota bacterium]
MTLLACGGGSSATVDFDGTTLEMKAKRDLEYNNAIESVYIIYQGDDAELSFDLVGAPKHGGITNNWFEINMSDSGTYEELGFAVVALRRDRRRGRRRARRDRYVLHAGARLLDHHLLAALLRRAHPLDGARRLDVPVRRHAGRHGRAQRPDLDRRGA